ncbi:hypothetical protein Enr10x_28440 [Gimesia panareensis]|uniref:Uncharacterized protein n=1 Tax=Gimesia panareensis TaxID=2527978 RepID=A0A518A4L4_9PLAN|nr:hypothetical protein Enr10x_28440 [Gimesia panareensis]QDU49642.1 hypothetical protein Pan110_19810 [Gimesia panareensis]
MLARTILIRAGSIRLKMYSCVYTPWGLILTQSGILTYTASVKTLASMFVTAM